MASNVAAGRSEHRAALVELGTPAALTTLLLSDQLDLQQEAAYGIWNVISHDRDLLAQAAKDDKIVSAFAGLVRAQSPPVVRCETPGDRGRRRGRSECCARVAQKGNRWQGVNSRSLP